MLEKQESLAIYMEGELTGMAGKMGYGILRYSPNPVSCIIDSTHEGQNLQSLIPFSPRNCPIVRNVKEARQLGAKVFVLGIAPPGGLIPPAWNSAISEAWELGLSIINGLHEVLADRLPSKPNQWVWDIRQEPAGLSPATGAARELNNTRLLMVGTDMAVGKMTAGLEIWQSARQKGIRAEFIATGQIGITLTGRGVPLDAVRVDFAGGAIEREVMACAASDLVIVEGQGALIHPGSTANLPLLRGSMATHLVLCHKANQTHLAKVPWVQIPPLGEYCRLYEELGSACGVFPRPKMVGVSLNTAQLSESEAKATCGELENELGLPVVDVIRDGGSRLVEALGI